MGALECEPSPVPRATTMFSLGYNTNGLPHHRVLDALDLLAELGYGAVSLTPDAGLLDPYDLRPGEIAAVRQRAADLGLVLTVETGTRFLRVEPTAVAASGYMDAKYVFTSAPIDAQPRVITLAIG